MQVPAPRGLRAAQASSPSPDGVAVGPIPIRTLAAQIWAFCAREPERQGSLATPGAGRFPAGGRVYRTCPLGTSRRQPGRGLPPNDRPLVRRLEADDDIAGFLPGLDVPV